MRANTVEQYKILKYLETNFNTKEITIEFISRSEVKVTDKNGDQLILMIVGNSIAWKDVA